MGMSDIFDSMSLGTFYDRHGMAGHGSKYYNSKGASGKINNKSNQQTEVFAQLFEAWANNSNAWKDAIEFYPNQSKIFEETMKGLL